MEENNDIEIRPILSELQSVVDKANTVKEYMTIKMVTEYLHVSERWVRRLMSTREIPYTRKKGKILFIREDIDRWMEEGRVKTSAEISAIASTYIHTR